MGTKKNVKEDVESVLLSLHAKIDSLRAKVEALCQSTSACNRITPDEHKSKKDK
tara:strand:- start:533 stop:694 length:162 start_codon:yes stop_codon:yes gene_type:complete